ncbi:NAD(P)/FAD-dependent oxidoreductase [Synechococcus elongatus IITB7]|uniref:NAD(P)/FAD-dependent oxidoreductase n=1 Tax=Synechococcus elongatus TaxID=32046 RepID=UPI0030D5F5B1
MTEATEAFDVVVVGAGPAGGQCARQLAKAGRSVLLVDQIKDWTDHDFSSGGTPLETLDRFHLPDRVVGRAWSKLRVVTTQEDHTWKGDGPLGVVLDFAALRQFLAEETVAHGGTVRLGWQYRDRQQLDDGRWQLRFRDRSTGSDRWVTCRAVVDATGSARKVIYQPLESQPDYLRGVGIEYLIEVPDAVYQRFDDALHFYLGHHWLPKGYSWIFPMQAGRLKVGACWFQGAHRFLEPDQSLRHYIDLLLTEQVQCPDYRLIDVHGAAIDYSGDRRDRHVQGSILAIGDAVSAINFLGGEGIRHGMESADRAAEVIEAWLAGTVLDFSSYERQIRRRFDRLWTLSLRLGMKKYLQDSDAKIDRIVRWCRALPTDDLMAILFDYRFQRLGRRLGRFLWLSVMTRLRLRWQRWRRSAHVA